MTSPSSPPRPLAVRVCGTIQYSVDTLHGGLFPFLLLLLLFPFSLEDPLRPFLPPSSFYSILVQRALCEIPNIASFHSSAPSRLVLFYAPDIQWSNSGLFFVGPSSSFLLLPLFLLYFRKKSNSALLIAASISVSICFQDGLEKRKGGEGGGRRGRRGKKEQTNGLIRKKEKGGRETWPLAWSLWDGPPHAHTFLPPYGRRRRQGCLFACLPRKPISFSWGRERGRERGRPPLLGVRIMAWAITFPAGPPATGTGEFFSGKKLLA